MGEGPISEFSEFEVSGSASRIVGSSDAEEQDARNYCHHCCSCIGRRNNDVRDRSSRFTLRRDIRYNSDLYHNSRRERVQRQREPPTRIVACHDRTSMRHRQSYDYQQRYADTRVCGRLLCNTRNRHFRSTNSASATIPSVEERPVQSVLYLVVYNPCIHAKRIAKRRLERESNEPYWKCNDLNLASGGLPSGVGDTDNWTEQVDAIARRFQPSTDQSVCEHVSHFAEF